MKAHEIAEIVGGEMRGDGDVEIVRAAALGEAAAGDLAFVSGPSSAIATSASCLIVPRGTDNDHACMIVVGNPKLAFARAAKLLHPKARSAAGIHPTAVVAATAGVSDDVSVGPYVCIGEDAVIGPGTDLRSGVTIGDRVRIGAGCTIHPNVVIEDGCSIGDNVVLHAGVVIGADGFGYVPDERGDHVKFPQIGTVVIEDDVEIGANSCVDRAALGVTLIGAGTKIDNLVQVAHNVRIGKRCVIAAETGISGSSTIGDDCVIGGQVGIADHVRIESGAIIGARSAVFPGKIVGPGMWAGTPVRPMREYKRQEANIRGLERLKNEVRRIASLIASGQDRD